MNKNRLEAFSDGVLAIIITIMVLEMKVPHGADWAALHELFPVFFSYTLSFIYVGIYWNNHHHMFHAVHHVNGRVLWANLHLLFWLSLLPFFTSWVGESHFAALPVALYGGVFMMAGTAYLILGRSIIAAEGKEHSLLAKAIGKDLKGNMSVVIYVTAIPLAFFNVWVAQFLYLVVALIWLVPDTRIEKVLNSVLHEA
jgi:uncharacterized membrane protein